MTDAAKAARRAYRREWQRANKDKCRAYMERYWEKKAAQQAGNSDPESEAAAHD